MARIQKVNLTITDNYIKIEFLNDSGVANGGVKYKFTDTLYSIDDDGDGWWFNRDEEKEYNYKLLFAQIVNLNGSAIGETTQAQVTALLLAAKAAQQQA